MKRALITVIVALMMALGVQATMAEPAQAHTPIYCYHDTRMVWHNYHLTRAVFLYHFNRNGQHYHTVRYQHGWWWTGYATNWCFR